MTRHLLLAAALTAVVPTAALAQAEAWWGHVTALAHDSMRGRETGSPEHRKAAEYVASVFRQAGLRAAGTDGWFQPVRFRVRRIDEARSSLALTRSGRTEPLAFGTDATINLRGSSAGRVDAPLVFIGYGLVASGHGYDDLKGLSLEGKVAVILAGAAPRGISGPDLAAARAAGAEALGAAGAIGVLTVASPHADIPWERYALSRLHPQMRLAADPAAPTGRTAIAVVLNHARAERLFAGAPQRYGALQALADSGDPLPRFELPVRLRATVAFTPSSPSTRTITTGGRASGASPRWPGSSSA